VRAWLTSPPTFRLERHPDAAKRKIQQLNAQIADLEQQSAQHSNNIIRRLGVQNSATSRRKELLAKAYQQQLGVVSDQSVKEVRYNILKK
jgi:hypothetical protein